jgi:heterotetrameric sarcosine oxidase gamma subunit
VPRLIAKTPLARVLPLEAAETRLSEVPLGRATSVAPFDGRERKAGAALRQALGLGFPAPNRWLAKGPARILWFGRGQALLVGAEPPAALDGLAAMTDQSDALAAMRLEGPLAEAALARLVPLDLRPAAFGAGHAARTLLFHMTCTICRTGPEGFEILVMRSMGRSAVHDLGLALRSVAAQR